MPTVFRWNGYRFFFYSADGDEPPDVHVVRGEHEAKVWLSDCSLALNLGFPARDLADAIRKIREERSAFLEAWNDYFADRG
ncbi:MAG TPA: DUF4160 domain-containing protein [Roseiarcus sp.]|jgi:hypothetical protein